MNQEELERRIEATRGALHDADIDGRVKGLFKTKRQRNITYAVVILVVFLLLAGGFKAAFAGDVYALVPVGEVEDCENMKRKELVEKLKEQGVLHAESVAPFLFCSPESLHE